MTRHVPILRGPRVTLRPPRDGDVAARQALGFDAEITRCYGGNVRATSVMSAVEAAHWIDHLQGHRYGWIIDVDGLIGQIRLLSHVDADQRAAVAIGIDDPRHLGQGLGTEALRLVADFAFDTLRLRRLSLRVLAFNTRAIRAYQKCGFIEEGRERRAALVDGTAHDDVIMGLLVNEYRATRA